MRWGRDCGAPVTAAGPGGLVVIQDESALSVEAAAEKNDECVVAGDELDEAGWPAAAPPGGALPVSLAAKAQDGATAAAPAGCLLPPILAKKFGPALALLVVLLTLVCSAEDAVLLVCSTAADDLAANENVEAELASPGLCCPSPNRVAPGFDLAASALVSALGASIVAVAPFALGTAGVTAAASAIRVQRTAHKSRPARRHDYFFIKNNTEVQYGCVQSCTR